MNKLIYEMKPFSYQRDGKVKLETEYRAAFSVAILLLPQAIIFSYLAGLPPEYGIYSAIFITFFAGMFGSSPMITGASSISALLISSAVLPLAHRGSQAYIDLVLLLTLMVGGIQLVIWLARGARFFQYLSPVVLSAIMAGTGTLLLLTALDLISGINAWSTDLFYQKVYLLMVGWADMGNQYALLIGSLTLIAGWGAKYFFPQAYMIIAVIAGYLVSMGIHAEVPQIESQVEFVGHIPFTLFPVSVPNMEVDNIIILFDSAVLIALIGLAQCMVVLQGIKVQKRLIIDDNKEVFAQGMSHLLGAFLSSFACAGSMNRTKVSMEAGVLTPVTAMLSSLFLILIVLLLHNILLNMPVPVLAAVLFMTGAELIKSEWIRVHQKSWQNTVLFWLTFFSIILIGLKTGIAVAILLSVAVFLKHANKLKITHTYLDDFQVITIHGSFFHASIDQLIPHFEQRDSNLILCLDFISYFDDAAAEYIQKEFALRAAKRNHLLVVAPVQKHKDCLHRAALSKGVDVYDSYTKARAAMEIINVHRFLRLPQNKIT